MKSRHRRLFAFFAFLLLSASLIAEQLIAQQTITSELAASAVVPRLVNFSGKAAETEHDMAFGEKKVCRITFKKKV